MGLVDPQPRMVTHVLVACQPTDTGGVDSVGSVVNCSAVGRALAEVTDIQHAAGTVVHTAVRSPVLLAHPDIADHIAVSSEGQVRAVDTHHDDVGR